MLRILVDVGHPAHVHFFKNFIWEMQERGHEVKIVARKKDITLKLLDLYGFEYELLGKTQQGLLKKGVSTVIKDVRLYKIARKFKPDVLTNIGGLYITHVGKLLNKPSLVFTDTESTGLQNRLSFPFCDAICTPSSFKKDLGRKHIRYNGCHDLAYLHPNYFQSNPSVLAELNLKKDDKFFVVRFVSWGASHDLQQKGFDLESKRKLVSELSKFGRVLITSESPLPREFEEYRVSLPVEEMHSLLAYASLYIGEGGTMASEAAILGTPSILVSTLAKQCGVFHDLRDNYHLLYFYDSAKEGIGKAVDILNDPDSKSEWIKKRDKLFSDKIDVTAWMVDFVENFHSK